MSTVQIAMLNFRLEAGCLPVGTANLNRYQVE
jgi:hypothetical protein